MMAALADKPGVPFRVPPGIRLVRVNLDTGQRAQAGDQRVILEAFKPGTEPDGQGVVIGGSEIGGGGSVLSTGGTPGSNRRTASGDRRPSCPGRADLPPCPPYRPNRPS